MKRQLSTIGLVLLLLALSIAMAAAQGGGRGFGGGGRGFGGGGRGFGGGGGLMLLRMPEVQKELNMTPDQISKIDDEQQQVRDSMQELMQNSGGDFQSMTPDQRQDLADKMQDINEKAVADILTDPAQLKRYHELELQREGPTALTQKSVQDQLGLTSDQKSHIAEINDKMNSDRMAAFQAAGGFQAMRDMSPDDRQKLFAKMTTITNDGNAKLLSVLTDDQKAKWKEMQGAPFTFPQGGGFGGFGGRRRGGGGGFGGGGPAVQ